MVFLNVQSGILSFKIMDMQEAKKELEKRFSKNPWIQLLEKVIEVREFQEEYKINRNKMNLARTVLSEKELDLHVIKLENLSKEKGIL